MFTLGAKWSRTWFFLTAQARGTKKGSPGPGPTVTEGRGRRGSPRKSLGGDTQGAFIFKFRRREQARTLISVGSLPYCP